MEEEKPKEGLPTTYNPSELFRLELTAQEFKTLSTLLPVGYSFQQDLRRKDKLQAKKKTPDELLLSELPQKAKNLATVTAPPPSKKGAQKVDLINQSMKPCLKTLQSLKQHKCAWPFLEPVDADGLGIPEYKEIIKQPMDFSTIEFKLQGGKYQNPVQFHQDVLKIFNNSYTFNAASDDFIKITNELQKYYYRISGEMKPIPQKALVKVASSTTKPQKKKKKPPTGSREMSESLPMTTEEKRQLAYHLHRLAKEHIKGVRCIVFDNNSEQNQFNLQTLSQKKLRELQKYVRSKIADMQNALHSNMLQKTQQQNLDELESQITEQFIEEPLEEDEAKVQVKE